MDQLRLEGPLWPLQVLRGSTVAVPFHDSSLVADRDLDTNGGGKMGAIIAMRRARCDDSKALKSSFSYSQHRAVDPFGWPSYI